MVSGTTQKQHEPGGLGAAGRGPRPAPVHPGGEALTEASANPGGFLCLRSATMQRLTWDLVSSRGCLSSKQDQLLQHGCLSGQERPASGGWCSVTQGMGLAGDQSLRVLREVEENILQKSAVNCHTTFMHHLCCHLCCLLTRWRTSCCYICCMNRSTSTAFLEGAELLWVGWVKPGGPDVGPKSTCHIPKAQCNFLCCNLQVVMWILKLLFTQ